MSAAISALEQQQSHNVTHAVSEGGTMGTFCREEIEMFCLARLINCYIDTDPENNFIDWYSSADPKGLRGMFELCHLMIVQPCWTESGFQRAKTTILSNSRAVNKSMERANHDKILHMVFGEDRRFREPNAEEIEALTLEGCREVLEKFMRPDNIEVCPRHMRIVNQVELARLIMFYLLLHLTTMLGLKQ